MGLESGPLSVRHVHKPLCHGGGDIHGEDVYWNVASQTAAAAHLIPEISPAEDADVKYPQL